MERKHPEPLERQEGFAIALKSSLAHTCSSASTTPSLSQCCCPPLPCFTRVCPKHRRVALLPSPLYPYRKRTNVPWEGHPGPRG